MDDDRGRSARTLQVQLGAAGSTFAAPADQPLLLAAEAAGLPWPSSCRNGTCRACIQRLLRGQVSYRIEWPGLLAEERRAGWILPCVAYPQGDLVVATEADGTQESSQEFPVT